MKTKEFKPVPREDEYTRATKENWQKFESDIQRNKENFDRIKAIEEIIAKWEKAGVPKGRIEQLLRKAHALVQERFYTSDKGKITQLQPGWFKSRKKQFVKRCSPALRRFIEQGLTQEDNKLVNEHYGPFTLTRLNDALSELKKGPLNLTLPIVHITEDDLKNKKGRPRDEILGPLLVYLIELLEASGLHFNKGPREKRIRWKDICSLLENNFPWHGPLHALTPYLCLDEYIIRDTYRHWKKRPLPPDWPKIEIIRRIMGRRSS